MHLAHIPQYTIQNRNVHISVVNGMLWDMRQVYCSVCEIDLLGNVCRKLCIETNTKVLYKIFIIFYLA